MDPLLDLPFEDISSLLAPFGLHFVSIRPPLDPPKALFFCAVFWTRAGRPRRHKSDTRRVRYEIPVWDTILTESVIIPQGPNTPRGAERPRG